MSSMIIFFAIICVIAGVLYLLLVVDGGGSEEKQVVALPKEEESAFSTPVFFETAPKIKLAPVYELNTHEVKYRLYNHERDFRSQISILYSVVIINNLWINEPFHSKFYKILMVIDKNEFMIKDKNSKIITMHMRDQDNKMVTSKGFQVFAAKDIAQATLLNSINRIRCFTQKDAQNIVIAICTFVLELSIHYSSNESPESLINNLLQNYKYANDVKHIVFLLRAKNPQLLFVHTALQEAFETTQTEPYNDSEIAKPLLLPSTLPHKQFREI